MERKYGPVKTSHKVILFPPFLQAYSLRFSCAHLFSPLYTQEIAEKHEAYRFFVLAED